MPYVRVALAQKSFEGEITYRHFGFDDTKKDTVDGGNYKVLFAKNAIKIEILTEKGEVFQEQLVYLDSLKEIIIDHRNKNYWVAWDGRSSKKSPDLSPWGMNKAEMIHQKQKIAGHQTDIKRLTNTNKTLNYGFIDLNIAGDLCYRLPPQVEKNLFLTGLLFSDNKIVLGISIVSGRAPHPREDYQAIRIEAKEIPSSEFTIPKDYKIKVMKKPAFMQ
jgi:hypothetical protein